MNDELIDVVITRREDQAEGIAVFELAAKQGVLPAFEAGAHIDVHIAPNLIRQYSLSNLIASEEMVQASDQGPGLGGNQAIYRLGILNDPQSRGGSKTVHEQFHQGTELKISAPRNHFPLEASAQHSILVGGGIGITPMLAMAYSLKAQGKSFELHYCCRSSSSAAFLNELAENFTEQTQLHFDDQPEEQRFSPNNVFESHHPGTHIYVCGPSGFMDWVISCAVYAGYPESDVHFEYFNANVDTSGDAFEVVAAQSGVTVQVQDGQTIADALVAAGVKIDVSCEQGVCGTCLCDVLEGTPDHKDHFLTQEEKYDNDQIVICCSRAKGQRLVLDI